ncbi:MAG: hypothetical protein WBP94_16215 [Rhodomicrobiaceae bacterium]
MQIKHQAANKATEIKNAAIAFGIYGNGARRLADLALTNKGLVLSNGNAKDVTVKWDALITWMSSQLPAGAKAKKPAKSRASAGTNGNRIAAPAQKSGKQAVRARKAPAKKAH